MADTLRNLSDARALIPDNATNLVSPQDVREYLLALEPDRGGYRFPSTDTPAELVLTQNVWFELNSATVPGVIPFPADRMVGWAADANARPYPSWGPNVIVAPTLMRAAVATCSISVDPDSNSDDVFEAALVLDGVVLEDDAVRFVIAENAGIAEITWTSGGALLQEDSIAHTVAIAVRNVSASRDLNLYSMAMLVQGLAYEVQPT